MFTRMIASSLLRRGSHALMAITASLVGAAALCCLACVCIAVPQQMREQMRLFGANMVLSATTSQGIAHEARAQADQIVASMAGGASASLQQTSSAQSPQPASAQSTAGNRVSGNTVSSAAYRYENVRINASPFVLAGINVDRVQTLNQHWDVQGSWPSQGRVLVGSDIAQTLGLQIGSTVSIEAREDEQTLQDETRTPAPLPSEVPNTVPSTPPGQLGQANRSGQSNQSSQSNESSTATSSNTNPQHAPHAQDFSVAGIVQTGGSEDSIIYATLEDVEALTGYARGSDVIEYSVNTTADQLHSITTRLNAEHLGQAQTVTRVTSSDAHIISMLELLFWLISSVVVLLTLVSVGTTVSSMMMHRRQEFALRKALGATDRSIIAECTVESGCYGLLGGLLGYALGLLSAWWLCTSVFHRELVAPAWILPLTLVLSVCLAVLASTSPVRAASSVDPAIVLREE